MKIIHCADVHLESSMRTHLGEQTAKERRQELLDTFLRLLRYAGEHAVDAVLIAGDLFDVRQVRVTTRRAILECIAGYPELAVYYLKGNHDHSGWEEEGAELPANLHFFGQEWTEYVLEDRGRRRIVLKGAELGAENERQLHEGLYLRQEDYNIVMLHGQLSHYAQKDKAEIIALDRLKHRGIDYLALGHIHSFSEGAIDPRGVWCYPGCLEGRGFDECGEHGFVLLEIDPADGSCRREFVPFAARQLHELRVDVSGLDDMPGILARCRGDWAAAKIPQKDMVKLILCGEVAEGTELAPEFLWQQQSRNAYFLKVVNETTEALELERCRTEQSLRGCYVRRLLADTSLAEEERRRLLRTGLLALAGQWERIEGCA